MGELEGAKGLMSDIQQLMMGGDNPEEVLDALYTKAARLIEEDEKVRPDTCFLFGELFYDAGRMDEALSCMNKGLELDPISSPMWFYKARILMEKEGYEEALACFDRFLECAKGDDQFIPTAYASMGYIHRKLEQGEEAIACFESALEYSPKFTYALIQEGLELHNMNRPDQAIDCYEKALEVNPVDEDAWIFKGYAFRELEQPENALFCFNQALGIRSDCIEALKQKIDILNEMGHREEVASLSEKLSALMDSSGSDDDNSSAVDSID